MTVPPEKATARASFSPLRAPLVVRLLAAVAIRMPKKPANPEHRAPTPNETATSFTFPSLKMANSAATARTKINSTLYSRARKAMAPSRTARPISCIFSVPGSCLLTQRDL